jgi:hypothetical protein
MEPKDSRQEEEFFLSFSLWLRSMNLCRPPAALRFPLIAANFHSPAGRSQTFSPLSKLL